jgi:hypothetical protein
MDVTEFKKIEKPRKMTVYEAAIRAVIESAGAVKYPTEGDDHARKLGAKLRSAAKGLGVTGRVEVKVVGTDVYLGAVV